MKEIQSKKVKMANALAKFLVTFAAFCSLVIFAAFYFLQEGQATRGWYKEDFPDPTIDVETCGRRGKVSWICDPENILSYGAADKIEELLYSVVKNTDSGCSYYDNGKPGFQIGVAVLNQMSGIPGEPVEETAKTLAKHLHDSWAVGHAGCDDGVMLLISILDRQLYVSTGKRAMELLSDDQIDIIIEEMKPYMLKKDYDKGVELAIVRMGEVFGIRSASNHGYIIFCAVLVIIIIILATIVVLCIKRKKEQSRGEWKRDTYPGISNFDLTKSDPFYLCKPDYDRCTMFKRRSFGSGVGFGGGGIIGGGGSGGSW